MLGWKFFWLSFIHNFDCMKKGLLLTGILLSGVVANAQLVDCDVFLQGNHMEIGINNNGAFGSSIQAPAGYHANINDTMYNDCLPTSNFTLQLGFVADPNLTNWASYYGDFIMPNNPREGWAMEHSTGGTGTAYSYSYYATTSGYTGPVSGSNLSCIASGSTIKGYWTGAYDSINVNQVVTIDTGNLYLLVHVGFYNTATVPDSFYYLRFINPHNSSVITSSLATKGKIEHQLPNPDGLVVVSATGLTDTLAYLALGTRDPRAKCFIMKDSTMPGPGTLASIWAGDVAHYNYTDTLSGDHGIGIVYKINLGPGDSSYLDYGYSFKGGIIDTALDTSLHSTGGGGGGGGGTLSTKAITGNQTITMFPNPANNSVYITGLSTGETISVYDLLGSELTPAVSLTGKGACTVSVSQFAAGTYLFVVKDTFGKVVSGQTIVKN